MTVFNLAHCRYRSEVTLIEGYKLNCNFDESPRMFYQWVLPLSLWCSIDSSLLAGQDWVVQWLIQEHQIFVPTHLSWHYALCRDVPGSHWPQGPSRAALQARQNMMSLSTNVKRGHKHQNVGDFYTREGVVAKVLEILMSQVWILLAPQWNYEFYLIEVRCFLRDTQSDIILKGN